MLANLSLLEALWIAVTLVALGLHLNLFREAQRDQKAVALRDGVQRLLVSHGNIRREGIRVAMQAIFLALSLWRGFLVPTLDEPALQRETIWTVTLILPQLLLIYSSFSDTVDRRTMLAFAKRQLAAGRLEVKEVNGAIVIESAPGAPDPIAKRIGGVVEVKPTTDEPVPDEAPAP